MNPPTHFESLYPENSRYEEIEKILGFIKSGSSCQLIGLPGVGRSDILEMLAYNKAVKTKHLGDNTRWFHFVLLHCEEMKGKSLQDMITFIFLSLADSLRDRSYKEEHDKIHAIFKQHESFHDEVVLFQGLKEAIDYLSLEKELTVVLLFDKFENYVPLLTPSFLSQLQTLKNRAKYRFSCVFSVLRPLDELLELTQTNEVAVRLYDPISLQFQIDYIQKTQQNQLDKKTIENIVAKTGGHSKLTRLSLERTLLEPLFSDFLNNKVIRQALVEIWDSLLSQEETPAIPLLQELIKTLPPKSTALENSTDSLTSLEFRLLEFLKSNPDRLIEKNEIIQAVWKESATTEGVTDQALDQLIFRLRKKIEKDANSPVHIVTIKGRGLKFIP